MVGFLILAATGVDLVNGRTGLGLVFLGASGVVFGLTQLGNLREQGTSWAVLFSVMGGGYFLWRAWMGEAVGLAIADAALVFVFLSVYLLTAQLGERFQRFLFLGLGGLLAVNVGVAMAQEFAEAKFYVWRRDPEIGGSTSGLFDHYNYFASFLNGSFYLVLSYVLLGRNLALRILGGFLGTGMVVALVMSGSRGGYLGFVCGGMFWLVGMFIYLKQTRNPKTGIFAIVAMVLGIGGLTSSFWVVGKLNEKRFEDPNGPKVERMVDDGGRLAFGQMAMSVFAESPVIGMGPRAFSYRSVENWDPSEHWVGNYRPEFAHNEYLQALSDYGSVGLGVILVLIFGHVVVGLYGIAVGARANEGMAVMKVGALAGLAAMLAQANFSFIFHLPTCIGLAGFLMGVLVSGDQGRKAAVSLKGPLMGLATLVATGCLFLLGLRYFDSYRLGQEARKRMASVTWEVNGMEPLDLWEKAGHRAKSHQALENAAKVAMRFGFEAGQAGETEKATSYYRRAEGLYLDALVYHPNLYGALIGLPQIYDSLGEWEKAEAGHQVAMKKLWSRELFLNPHFNASRSSFLEALRMIPKSEFDRALLLLGQAEERFLKRREILNQRRELPEMMALSEEIQAWKAFLEARLLLLEGERVWKTERPRNPELAHAFFLEAEKRYLACEKRVKGRDPRWEGQLQLARGSLEILKAGQVPAAELSEEMIEKVVTPEVVLASKEAKR